MVLHQRDAAGFEIAGIDRVVDVLVRIEIGVANIVRDPMRKIFQARLGARA
jgi:hypothetical protein